MEPHVLIIGGSGAVGILFCQFFVNARVKTVSLDLQIPPMDERIVNLEYVESDAKELDLAFLHDKTLVLLATPERLTHTLVSVILPLLGPHQCLIETTSVKSEIYSLMRSLKPSCECIGINPMFGPSLGFNKQSIAWIELNSGPISNWFMMLIENADCCVYSLDAEEHDRNTAAIQAATHAAILTFGMTLLSLDYNPTFSKPIWTPPHKIMLTLLTRLLGLKPDVFIEIQSKNPHAGHVRQHMQDNLKRICEIVGTNSADEMTVIFDNLQTMVFDEIKSLNNLCQDIFIRSRP